MTELRTPFYDIALAGGARFQEWYGWELPQSYGEVASEYRAAREEAALHDSSYTGRIRATGEDVLDLVNRLSTNEVVSLPEGQGAATVLTTDRGRILDLLSVLNLGDHILILTSPQTRDTVMEWIDKYTFVEDVTLEDVTPSTAMLSVIGPKAQSALGNLVSAHLENLASHQSESVSIAGAEGHIIRRDLVNTPRFEVVVLGRDAATVWQAIVATGAVPMGMEAFEAMRVEEGAPAYDRELSESYNPLETGLWGSISFTKGCYIGQEVIARLDTYQKVQKHLVSLRFSAGVAGSERAKLSKDGREVGQVTSAAWVPTTGVLVGLGYVRKEAAAVGTVLSVAGEEGTWACVETQVLPLGPGA